MNKIFLDGNSLTIEDIQSLISDHAVRVEIAPETFQRLQDVRGFLNDNLEDRIVYGINTGFGPMASHIIGNDQLLHLQENLIRSHAVGMGDPIKPEYVLAAMCVRLNTLVKGYSGITQELASHLQSFINHRIIPIVPEHGAVGTSGDLVQLAHIALSLIGEGEVLFQEKRQPTSVVLKQCGLKSYRLQPKEGLALINGTSMMAAITAVLCLEVDKLTKLAVHTGAWSLEMVNGFEDSISEKIHLLRPHVGQQTVAKLLRTILSSSKLLQNRSRLNTAKNTETKSAVHQIQEDVQDVYSIRCIPQILGPVFDSLATTRTIVETEINSVTDNPIIDADENSFLHGGNFHGDYIAYAVDQLKMTVVKLTMLSERRINYFLNAKVNHRFPPFMNLDTPGLTLGLQGIQFVATSTTAQSQTLAFPQYVHSIPTNADNQDIVSMGTDAALIASRVVDNAFVVLSIEMLTLAQAVDYSKNEKELAGATKKIYKAIRSVFPVIKKDRVLNQEIQGLLQFVKNTISSVL
ncbi:MAG: aromatic amino acid ammonia-lyase [Patescibacteria group bacterium]